MSEPIETAPQAAESEEDTRYLDELPPDVQRAVLALLSQGEWQPVPERKRKRRRRR